MVLGFSGWMMQYDESTYTEQLPLGTGAWEGGNPDGVALLTCGLDCGNGDTYTLWYSATVSSGVFATTPYGLHLAGTISTVPVPAAMWLFTSGLIGFVGAFNFMRQSQ